MLMDGPCSQERETQDATMQEVRPWQVLYDLIRLIPRVLGNHLEDVKIELGVCMKRLIRSIAKAIL